MSASNNNLQPPTPSTDPRPLPLGWTRGTTITTNQQFWVHAATNIKTYYAPRNPSPHRDGFAAIPVEGEPLPEGWEVVGREVKLDGDGNREGAVRRDVVYLDHNTHSSTGADPRS
ncbi:hypothetical protein DL98DRAFT_534784 [Cadophora sp. DSE1049]|nr:hypothetical protein DL98DRAFT_534784 [Cadophora sp. DSE1049]